ncbi:hypothetical protein MVES1_002756 [Malassezia vespertilionis]|uniref:uncharacterized protein n=1 Tax=Malassezia vespertilionis TaxID=2020962 RepID=UPI0024B15A4F|nr:uncharacterized protein MVES1_002756 [Malassezia vespertilionis]WFD07392.1 hypothetical protein MVES1_002756 [Malassezia vespertilionis]
MHRLDGQAPLASARSSRAGSTRPQHAHGLNGAAQLAEERALGESQSEEATTTRTSASESEERTPAAVASEIRERLSLAAERRREGAAQQAAPQNTARTARGGDEPRPQGARALPPVPPVAAVGRPAPRVRGAHAAPARSQTEMPSARLRASASREAAFARLQEQVQDIERAMNDTTPSPPIEQHAAPREDARQDTAPAAPAQERSEQPARTRRRESRRNRRSNTLLATLSQHTHAGPGALLPSLYGYFSDEPAPTALRPAAGARAAQSGDGQAHVNTNAPARMHPDVAERILASGPSISNIEPAANVLLTPGAGARVHAAKLRNRHVQPGSVAYAPGVLSNIADTSPAHDAQLSRRFEENAVLSFLWRLDNSTQFLGELRKGEKKHEGWNMRPLFGNEQWLLSLAAVPDHTLTVHLTNLAMPSVPFSAALSAQVMFGIRAPSQLLRMPRMLESEYLWRVFLPYTFSQDNTTLSSPEIPNLDELLSDPMICASDAFELVVQVACGPSVLPERSAEPQSSIRLPFETSDTVNVPRSLVQSLGNFVDDASTGDLMIIVREKGIQQLPSKELAESVGLTSFVQPWPTGTPMPTNELDEPAMFVRDRVLWAHSAILRARSEFFATMLDSSFSESLQHDTSTNGGRTHDAFRRPYRVLRIPDADYVSMYWLLRYLYTEDVQLLKKEDIQAVTLDDHWILGQESSSTKPDWKWRSIEMPSGLDDSMGDEELSFSRYSQSIARTPMQVGATSNPVLSDMYNARHVEVAMGSDGGTLQYKTEKSERVMPRSQSGMLSSTVPSQNKSDPHPHPPMLPVSPASALSMYRLAHRYNILPLCDITNAHIIAQLTPENATNYLLCTALFDQLQFSIQTYICAYTPC